MRRWPSSLFGRLVIGATIFTVVALGVTLIVMDRVLERFVTGQIDQRLDNKLIELVSQVRVKPDGTINVEGDADGPPFDEPHHQSFWRIAGPKNAIQSRWLTPGAFATPSAAEIEAAPVPPAPPHPGPGPGPRFKARTLRGPGPDGIAMHMRVVMTRVDTTSVTLLAAAPRRAIADPVREAMTTIAAAIVVLGVASFLAAVWLARLVLQPLARLRGEVAEVRRGRLTSLDAAQPAEVRPLVEELNSLLAQNAGNLARARKHVANLAHGIKTPLATLSLGLARLDGSNLQLAALVDTIDRRIPHHLGRARAAALEGPVRSHTNLADRLNDVIDALRKIHADKAVVVELICPPAVTVACEPQDADEMLGNLLENAFKYARRRVGCLVRQDDSAVRIDITDDGPGLTAEEIARVLRPGERLDEDVAGYGFGLPIARELIELYGGELTLEGSGTGLHVSLKLPRST